MISENFIKISLTLVIKNTWVSCVAWISMSTNFISIEIKEGNWLDVAQDLIFFQN